MSSRLFDVLHLVARHLRDARTPWALVGGLAVSARAEPRFTRDIDVVVAVDSDLGAETLVRGLLREGFVVSATLDHDVLRRLATVRLVPPGETVDGVIVDLLFASSGIEPEICGAAEPIEIGADVVVPVARTGHLLAQKVLSRGPDRLQDDIDIQALMAVADEEERDRCRQALRFIERRGANRGKDLLTEFQSLLK